MECFPVCRTCTGLCKREPPAKPVTQRRKKPVAPKKMPGYIVLICGKATTPEEQRVLFSAAGRRFPVNMTRKTKFWCEKHGRWERPYTFAERIRNEAETLPF